MNKTTEKVIALTEMVDTLQEEIIEQARIIGMGVERELALLAKIERLEKQLLSVSKPAIQ